MSPSFSFGYGFGLDRFIGIGDNGGPPIEDWPDESNTGPTGPLTPASGEVRMWAGDGSTVLENVDLDGWVIIQSPNCKIRNCRISTNNEGGVFNCIRIDWGSGGTGEGLEIIDCEIDGNGVTVNGFSGSTDGQFPFARCHIHGVHNGINVGSGVYEDNYIVITEVADPEAHYDGVEVLGAENLYIRRNRIICDVGQTSAINMTNYFDGISNVEITDNWLSGGGYTLYVDDRSAGGPVVPETVLIENNKMGIGQFGYWALYTSGVTPIGNYDEITGANVDP